MDTDWTPLLFFLSDFHMHTARRNFLFSQPLKHVVCSRTTWALIRWACQVKRMICTCLHQDPCHKQVVLVTQEFGLNTFRKLSHQRFAKCMWSR